MAYTIDLTEITVLVTGASRGIGRAIAKTLAEAGAQVAVHFCKNRDLAEALVNEIGENARAFQADLGEMNEVKSLFDEVLTYFGKLDVLVNNAGIAVPVSPNIEDGNWLDAWDTTMDVNLKAAALLSKLSLKQMVNCGEGRLIHIASRAAFRGDTAEYIAYAASKGGLIAMHRSIARFYGKQGIKSFAIAPGFTHTDMAQQFIDDYGEDWATHDLALSTLTKPEDIAPTVLMLASGLMDHATGSVIDINAGSYIR